MKAILINGGHVVDPANGRDEVADVLIVNGKIAAVGIMNESDVHKEHPQVSEVETLSAKGLVVAPGLIDLRAHMGEPGHDSEESIAHGAEVAAGDLQAQCAGVKPGAVARARRGVVGRQPVGGGAPRAPAPRTRPGTGTVTKPAPAGVRGGLAGISPLGLPAAG